MSLDKLLGFTAMSQVAVGHIRAMEADLLQRPQVDLPVDHWVHAGMYFRTVRIPAGVGLTGALIKIPTVVIVSGDCTVHDGLGSARLTGYHVLPAAAGRKQAFAAHADTHLTMAFPTSAKTVEEAEAEFTDEVHMLQSRMGQHQGETVCQE